MRNPAYLYLPYASSFICDGSSFQSYGFKPHRFEWTDDEIKAIRDTLKKLTSIRIMNTNDVEDLVQETLLTMISRHPGAELQKGPLVYSMGILRRKLGNYYRKMRRYAPLNEQDASFRQTVPSLSPDTRLLQKELKALDTFWGAYEIMGVSLVDMQAWHWLYDHPQAGPGELKQAVIARDGTRLRPPVRAGGRRRRPGVSGPCGD